MQKILMIGGLIRFVLILYGDWQDRNMEVKYTDVDYRVFEDAARHVWEGRSPYERATYRYSPLLAYVLIPNVVGFPIWGKILFGVADLSVGILIYRILLLLRSPKSEASRFASYWILNPLAVNVSTRGNGDALVGVMILTCMWLLLNHHYRKAGLLYGLAVHFRIYPIVYAPAIFLFLGPPSGGSLLVRLLGLSSTTRKRQWSFVLTSVTSFVTCSIAMYMLYGEEFLEQCFLYHLRRADSRHNFSVHFYSIYLENGTTDRVFTFIPQLFSILTLTFNLFQDLPLCMLTLTMTFVTFNKVITAQYFLWYVILLPLALPFVRIKFKYQGLCCILLWFVAETHWLYWGYQLEFKGQSHFTELWIASLVFFIVNIALICFVIRRADIQSTWSRIGGDIHSSVVVGKSSWSRTNGGSMMEKKKCS